MVKVMGKVMAKVMGKVMVKALGKTMTKAMGKAMATALLTTLYGALFANFLFLPFADKLKGKNEDKKVQSALITEGILLIAQKAHPLQVREKLNAYLPPKMRKKPEDE